MNNDTLSRLARRGLAALVLACCTTTAMAQSNSVIRTQPEGTLRTYQRDGQAFYAYYGDPTMTTQNYTVLDIVTAPDGRMVYMKNPISQANAGTWIKGTMGDDGKLHVPLGQVVQMFDAGYGWKTVVLRMGEYDDFVGATYYIDDEMAEVTFTVSEDGNTIEMDDLGGEDAGGYPGAMYALVYTDDETFVGYADYNSRYTPFDMSFTTIPEGLETELWTFTYSNAQPGEEEQLPVAREGNKLYIAGLSIDDPEAAIVGTVDGDRVSFVSDQYVGCSSGFLLYAFGASYEEKTYYDEVWDETYTTYAMKSEPELNFRYNAATGLMKAEGDVALVLNMGAANDVGINYMSVSLDPQFQGPAKPDGLAPAELAEQAAVRSYYDLSGRSGAAPRGGITIVKRGDGTVRKSIVR